MKKVALMLLSIVAYAAGGQTIEGTSNPVAVEVTKPAHTDADAVTLASLGITKVPRYYALVIGVSTYQFEGAKLPNLEMPAKDAAHLASLLTEKYFFDAQDVILLKDPSREEIINQLDHLSQTITNKDNLLIFYAGHGYYDKANDFGYWLPADAKLTSRSAWIPNSTIKDYVGAIKAKHTLLITDACFGGSIFKTRSVDAEIRQLNELYRAASRRAMTSGNLTEVPDQSIFIRYVVKTLEENDKVCLPASTLFTRIYEPILNNAPAVPQFGVIQGAGDESGDFIFIKRP